MRNRLREIREKRGLTLHQVADKLGVNWQTVQRKEIGQTGLSDKQAEVYAKVLECDPADLFVKAPIETISVRAAVEAGFWSAALEWDEDDWYDIAVPEDGRFPGARRFALEVRGPSMNMVYPEGSALVCVPLAEIDLPPQPGKRYIVYRRNQANEIEATCKELRVDEQGKGWLWPVSNHPQFQSPIPIDDDNEFEVEIYALVILSVRPE